MTGVNVEALCGERAGSCRCAQPADHVEAGDPVHGCHPDRCTGQWAGRSADGNFRIVSLPFPVGEPRPWDDEDEDDIAPFTSAWPTVPRGGIRYGLPS